MLIQGRCSTVHVLDIAENDACHAGGNREHDTEIVGGIDTFRWVARGPRDDEDEQCCEDDDGDVEECCGKNEMEVSFGERLTPIVYRKGWQV